MPHDWDDGSHHRTCRPTSKLFPTISIISQERLRRYLAQRDTSSKHIRTNCVLDKSRDAIWSDGDFFSCSSKDLTTKKYQYETCWMSHGHLVEPRSRQRSSPDVVRCTERIVGYVVVEHSDTRHWAPVCWVSLRQGNVDAKDGHGVRAQTRRR